MKVLRIVPDTNVLISGSLFSGNPYKILKNWRNGKIKIITSPKILNEMADVFDKKFKRPEDEIEEFRTEIVENAIIVEPQIKLDVIKEDPDDNMILEAAVEGGADFITPGDKHLKGLKEFKGIPILSPSKMSEIIEKY